MRFVREQAAEFGVDPQRVALGGFSAGGLSAVNAAYGMGAPSLGSDMTRFTLRSRVLRFLDRHLGGQP